MGPRLTLVNLLIGVILINLVLIGLFVFTIAGQLEGLSAILPGTFGVGGDFWGNYVFLSLVLLVNALLFVSAAVAVLVPAMVDGVTVDPGRIVRLLTGRAAVSQETADAVAAAIYEDQDAAFGQVRAARHMFRFGVLLFVVAFPLICFTVAHAEPKREMFAAAHGAILNETVAFDDVALFAVDQIANVVFLDAPEVYGTKLSKLTFNPDDPRMPTAVFAFRMAIGFMALIALMAILRETALLSYRRARPAAPERPGKEEEISAAADEHKAAA